MKTITSTKPSTLKTIGIALLAALSLLASCQKNGGVKPIPTETATPIIDFTWVGKQTAPATITFTNSTQRATAYRWDLGNGQISTLQAPTQVTYTQPGTYDILLVATNGDKQSVLKKTLVIAANDDPVAHFTYTFKDLQNSAPAVVNFFNESVDATAYEWNVNGALYSATVPPSIRFNQPGTYKVKLVAIKNGIRSAPYEETITVVAGDTPIASFALAYHPYPYSVGEHIQFVSRSMNCDGWEWTFGTNGQKSSQEHPLVKFDAAGMYTITLVAKKGNKRSEPRSINLKIGQ
ncbi:PKD domain-containing protein [Mucilaginibacter myungsuensis]|uniref:PKD domain-containing protein n=1 Tax=Mucilaginibacter myungsuensis TaxID=649104 RepID=A0A929KW44_9SPHI|nr:PKD domain-containing protein [Mucilaginibacter myungsuensis]MBE9662696.1 PKD domain-containing protein [Mucilaginibacter myungsuensis]MDN3598116.1 PKD domain-containing protein [Mucilaginibacter myungsuensis]